MDLQKKANEIEKILKDYCGLECEIEFDKDNRNIVTAKCFSLSIKQYDMLQNRNGLLDGYEIESLYIIAKTPSSSKGNNPDFSEAVYDEGFGDFYGSD